MSSGVRRAWRKVSQLSTHRKVRDDVYITVW